MKEVSKKTIILFCLPQFAVGLFTTMLNNYLIYFYQPTAASGLPTLITQGYVVAGILTVIGLIKALGHILDAVSDPVVASLSDKFVHPQGRRIPFMKWSAIPFALSALLILAVFTYVFPQIALFDMGLKQILLNTLLLTLRHPLVTLKAALLQVIYWALFLAFFPISQLALPLTGLWLPMFMGQSVIYPSMEEEFDLEALVKAHQDQALSEEE